MKLTQKDLALVEKHMKALDIPKEEPNQIVIEDKP